MRYSSRLEVSWVMERRGLGIWRKGRGRKYIRVVVVEKIMIIGFWEQLAVDT